MKIVIITQARLSSSRFPMKILALIDSSDTLLSLHLKRLKKSKLANQIVVATTHEKGIETALDIARKNQAEVFQGSESDVLDRFYQAAKYVKADIVVRVTSDCPLIDSKLIDELIEFYRKEKVDYASVILKEQFPDGVDCEVFSFKVLEQAWKEAKAPFEREHVTPYIWQNSTLKGGSLFSSKAFENKLGNFSQFRITVDTPNDLDVIKELIKKAGKEQDWKYYIDILDSDKNIKDFNMNNSRNEGYFKSKAQEAGLRFITNFKKSDAYRSKIHDLIPGGAHTYSKGDDQFPILSPAAIAHGKGSHVWDLDGNEFLDCSMGLTSISLGHAYEPVIKRVKEELDKGVNFQRPSYIELEIAEKFLELIPCHQMIKFAKNGSTATTAAVKLARAYTERKLAAFPHDHPFYSYDDWFIGKTQANRGIPEEITKLTVTYQSENLDSLKELFAKYPGQIACVISEPEKPHGLPAGYLDEAIKFVQSQGALYILDEMITGFKTAFPGSITKYNVSPDMATWGKGIANGFSFCALTGKKEVMELGGIRAVGKDKLFLISTTHGGETTALAAAIATIDEFKKHNVVAHNHQIGAKLRDKIQAVLKKANMQDYIDYQAADWMQLFIFKNKDKNVCSGMRTLMLQEMIRRGVLFQGAFVPCFSHNEADLNYFAKAFELSLEVYALALENGYQAYLVGEPTKPVFRKLI
ncbi:MAG: glutamate-1-semialdehyde 2,1-aminomutase [Bacteriovorax sp.]|jgi:spore coat polysaccharide biosynthesis protein SpsF